MDKSTALNVARRYADKVRQILNPAHIVLYGSYAKGEAQSDSDIDIAIICNGFDGNFLKTSAALWKLTVDVSTYIEPVLLDSAHDPSGFTDEIMKTGEILYRA